MTIKDLLKNYKGNVAVSVKKILEEEVTEIVSFDTSEKDAIKDEIMNAEISKWYIDVANKVPPYATITVLFSGKTDTTEPTDPTPDTNDDTDPTMP